MKRIIDLERVHSADVSKMQPFFPHEYDKHCFNIVGKGADNGEHYKLLNFFGSEVFSNEILLDIGTRAGMSALALALSGTNLVITYDVIDCSLYTNVLNRYGYPNIVRRQLDINLEQYWLFNKVPLIFLDIDPHDGIQEDKLLKTLMTIDYSGLVILDDIYWPEMKKLWDTLDTTYITKYDITKFGHGSGTGLLDFSGREKFEILGL